MAYQVERIDATGIGHFNFQIHKDSGLVAVYWYNIRDNQHGFVLENRVGETWPLTNAAEILEGGGLPPLRLTEFAVTYLNEKLQSAI